DLRVLEVLGKRQQPDGASAIAAAARPALRTEKVAQAGIFIQQDGRHPFVVVGRLDRQAACHSARSEHPSEKIRKIAERTFGIATKHGVARKACWLEDSRP